MIIHKKKGLDFYKAVYENDKGILKRQDLTSNDKVILLWSLSMSENFQYNLASMATLTGLTYPTIHKSIKNLEKKKFLKRIKIGCKCYEYEFFDSPYEKE